MPSPVLRIVTRKSPLALWQAEHARSLLEAAHPGLAVEIIGMHTTGDRISDVPLARVGGKGLFVKELEQALMDGRADLAVHSMKDVTVDLPAGLAIGAMLEREDPRDAFVSNTWPDPASLPEGSSVGTSSLRRQAQLAARRPDLRIIALRGNVGTRLRKLDEGEFDAIVLAAAGLKRLGLADRATALLPPEWMLPAIGQGAIGIECREDDTRTQDLLAPLEHAATRVCVAAERALNRRLGGACQVPVAGHAELTGDGLRLRALVARVDGSEIVHGELQGPAEEGERLGHALAEDLLARGAGTILGELMSGG